jgi:hypothetical protein
MKIHAYCDGCAQVHPIDFNPEKPDNQLDDWRYKHSRSTCKVWVDWRQRTTKPSWVSRLVNRWKQKPVGEILTASPIDAEGFSPILGYLPNANVKLAYAASAAMTYTSLNSLASSSTLVAGASALAVDNTSNLYLDYQLGGFVTNIHTPAPTVNTEIDVYLYRAIDDTPTYPDTMAGTDAAKTVTTANILSEFGKQVASLIVAATVDQKNWFDAGLISQYWGSAPSLWSVFTVHNSGQALNSAGGTVSYKGQYVTVI